MTSSSLEDLLVELYDASSYGDRSRVPGALDRLLGYVTHWGKTDPGRVDALFERLDPAQVVRAVGQTLLAATRHSGSRERVDFAARFLASLRSRGTPAHVVSRLEGGLASRASGGTL